MREPQVQSLGGEYPLVSKGMATHSIKGKCLENSMDRGTWWDMVHGDTKVRHY